MKDYSIDGHKLHLHPVEVAKFITTGDVNPIYIEVSPVGSCNHRCIFCAYDFVGYPNRKLDKKVFCTFIDDVAEKGLKSVLFAGEGEPLMHPNIDELIGYTKSKGVDVGMFSNASLLSENLAKNILKNVTFLRFSFNGGNEKNYSEIHKVNEESFSKILNNIKNAVKIKKIEKLEVTLGVQFVLLPENVDYIENIVKIFKEIGVDYFSVKPFVMQDERQGYRPSREISPKELLEIKEKILKYSDENFNVIFREDAFVNYGVRKYSHCYGTSFITVLNSAGDLASCLPYWDKKEFVYGNIYNNSFSEIWNGDKRKKIKDLIENKMDIKKCPPNCRADKINRYLDAVVNKNIEHFNFI